MRIQHNIMAMNAYRNYTNNTSALSKNLEKLSSGYKINRAGDDAAGLAISEKMRAQITGLATAQKNAKDGISLVQTAEGALTEVHSMLNRMVELADQSANGTYADEVDRENLQKEFDALRSEINRISQATNFNGINLLNGDQKMTTETISQPTDIGELTEQLASATTGNQVTTIGAVTAGKYMLQTKGADEVNGKFSVDLSKVSFASTTTGNQVITLTVGGKAFAVTYNGVTVGDSISATNIAASIVGSATQVAIGSVTFNITVSGSSITFEMDDVSTVTTASLNVNFGVALGASAGTLENTASVGATVETQGVHKVAGNVAYTSIEMTADLMKDGYQLTLGNTTYTFAVGADSKVDKTGSNVIDLTEFSSANGKLDADGKLTSAGITAALHKITDAAAGNSTFVVGASGNHLTLMQKDETLDMTTADNLNSYIKLTDGAKTQTRTEGGLTLQIGDTSDSFNQLTVSIDNMDCKHLGIIDPAKGGDGTTSLADVRIDNQPGAADAVEIIKKAINDVSSTRGDLGALQNRLEHTINNLSVMEENIQDAEASIRDVDVAKEMMSYTKNNILVQSAQAMLAQANQVPQGVLQLLQ